MTTPPTPPITPPQSELDLRELLAKATPGPWEAHKYVGNADNHFVRGPSAERVCGQGSGPVREANAALIVAAVNSLPELLDENARLREALERIADAAECDQIGPMGEGVGIKLNNGTGAWMLLEDFARAALHPKEQTDAV